jgi:hypothetical protein
MKASTELAGFLTGMNATLLITNKKSIMKTIIDKREYAQQLAFKIHEDHYIDLRKRELIEHLDSLRGDKEGFTKTLEPFNDLHDFVTEVACLLTNPKISKKLTKYTRKHAGDMLSKMLWFFDRMRDKDMYMLLLHYRLGFVRDNDNTTEEELKWVAELINQSD